MAFVSFVLAITVGPMVLGGLVRRWWVRIHGGELGRPTALHLATLTCAAYLGWNVVGGFLR